MSGQFTSASYDLQPWCLQRHSRALTREKPHYQPHYLVEFLPGTGQNQRQHFSTFLSSFASLCPLTHISVSPPLHSTTPISLWLRNAPHTDAGQEGCSFISSPPPPCRRPKAEGTYHHIPLCTSPPDSAAPPVCSQPCQLCLKAGGLGSQSCGWTGLWTRIINTHDWHRLILSKNHTTSHSTWMQ